MFNLSKAKTPSKALCCLISEYGYSLVGLESARSIGFCEDHYFTSPTPSLIEKSLSEDVEKYHLHGRSCQVILTPALYQLLLMDAPAVAEHEMAKALRWQLKGLIDYPLNDIAIDTFTVPPHGAGLARKKVFCSITLQSALINNMTLFENCLLNVTAIGIAELALSRLVSLEHLPSQAPSIVISFDDETCQLHVYYDGDLYLLRTLSMSKTIVHPGSSANQNMLLEIQRSIDYCLMELKFPEPKRVFFTPSFYEASDLFIFLQAELGKEVKLLDVNSFFTSPPIAPEVLAKTFYAIGGALIFLNGEVKSATSQLS